MYLIYALLWLVTDGLVSRLKYNVLQPSAAEEDKKGKGDRKKVSAKRKGKRRETDWSHRMNPCSLDQMNSGHWATCTGLAKHYGPFSFILQHNYDCDRVSAENNIHSPHWRRLKITPNFGGKNYEAFFLTCGSWIYSVRFLP